MTVAAPLPDDLTPAAPGAEATAAAQARADRFLDALLERGRLYQVLYARWLARFRPRVWASSLDRMRRGVAQSGRPFFHYLSDPRRGDAGRRAAAAYGAPELEVLRKLARECHADGLADAAIAQRLGCSVKTVSRYLHGHRLRRRTGAPRRGARGRFEPEDRRGHPKRHEPAGAAVLDSNTHSKT